MNNDILKVIREKGLLLEKDIFDIISNLEDAGFAKSFLEIFERFSGQKLLTKSVIKNNFSLVRQIVNQLPGDEKNSFENIIIKLGLQLEVRKEKGILDKEANLDKLDVIKTNNQLHSFKVFYSETKSTKKLEVGDFVGNFRARYQTLQRILMQRPNLGNLVAINKISGNRQQWSIIGILYEKRVTKNKNLILVFEDLTGSIAVLAKPSNKEVFQKSEEMQLDDVVAIKASGNRDILFAHEIYYPDAFINEKIKFENDFSIGFLSDIHCGSDRHLKKSFNKFLKWLEDGGEEASKIKYLFFTGDNVDGVGIFPGQEAFLELKSMKEQYEVLANYIKRIPKNITVFMCPGQHDAVRVAEPQPLIDKKYAQDLYDIGNLILVTNPAIIKFIEGMKEFKVLMYHGASIHNLINGIPELREMKAHRYPAKAVKHMLKRRHLAPTHSSSVYIPNAEKDPLVIYEVPDVLCTGEVHRVDVENYNGVLIITGSCWQAQTDFEEKVGNVPDPAKLPVLNLRTRELKVYDFLDEEELK